MGTSPTSSRSTSTWGSTHSSDGPRTTVDGPHLLDHDDIGGSFIRLMLFLGVGFIVLIFVFSRLSKSTGRPRDLSYLFPSPSLPPIDVPDKFRHPGAAVVGAPQVDVSAVLIAIDWRARAAMQAKLATLAQGSTSSPGDLVRLLGEVIAELKDVKAAWLYGGAIDADPMAEHRAQASFAQIASDLRARFRYEVARNVDGQHESRDAPALRAKPEEGEGVVVVSLVVASRRDIGGVGDASDAISVSRHLDRIASLKPSELIAMEVIWSPAAEEDRMSTAELEVRYGELKKLDEATLAGRVFCSHCSAPYAAELRTCPSCGHTRLSSPV